MGPVRPHRIEIRANGTAITATVSIGRITPSNNGAVLLERRKGVVSGEDVRDTRLQIGADWKTIL